MFKNEPKEVYIDKITYERMTLEQRQSTADRFVFYRELDKALEESSSLYGEKEFQKVFFNIRQLQRDFLDVSF